jgi:hypothetical protein
MIYYVLKEPLIPNGFRTTSL